LRLEILKQPYFKITSKLRYCKKRLLAQIKTSLLQMSFFTKIIYKNYFKNIQTMVYWQCQVFGALGLLNDRRIFLMEHRILKMLTVV
jgi:hypothetical protein